MAMPAREDYRKAAMNPANFGLPLLQRLRPARNPETGEPMEWPGAFGTVLRMESANGEPRALKCFTSPYPIRSERYEILGDYLDGLFSRGCPSVPFLTESFFATQGIRLGHKWYPVLLMDWVEGEPLNAAVQTMLETEDPADALTGLARRWAELVRALRADRLVHGDLQHGNILVLPGSELKLIDYDGMCVPSLIGRFVLEGGHPNYQHPKRTQKYSERLDEFSALVILAGLLALVERPELWEKYNIRRNILFHQADFTSPDSSPLFNELEALPDSPARTAVSHLRNACYASNPDTIPDLLPLLNSLSLLS